ncbi:N/A [soil metagenome]
MVNDSAPAEALLIVDAQNAFMAGADAVPEHDVLVPALGDLLRRARAAHALVVHLQNDGPPGEVDEPHRHGWELFYGVEASDHEFVIRKSQDDGFDGTELQGLLTHRGVRRLAIGGVMSEMCVGATARGAMARGFEVVIPHDGHATYNISAAPGSSAEVPAAMVSRVAEWSLGDEVDVVARTIDVSFVRVG